MDERAKRFNEGKPQLSLVFEFRRALEGSSYGFAEGVAKYGRGNWRKGMPITEILDSLGRHLTAYMGGEEIDPDSGLPHLDKLLCNALMASEHYHMKKDKLILTEPGPGVMMGVTRESQNQHAEDTDMTPGSYRQYTVTLTYASCPPIRVRVAAESAEGAISVAVLDATSRGWPREYLSANVEIE